MKHEWKKHEKALYLPKAAPELINVPQQKFWAIKGQGSPNSPDFAAKISVLYALAYAVRMMPKSGYTPDGYFEYTVYPLEGLWSAADLQNKAAYQYTLMIRQPDFVNAEVVARAEAVAAKKKPQPFLKDAFICEFSDGLAVQMLHLGAYDQETASFAQMLTFCQANGLSRIADTHREIYLTDPNKTAQDQLKTVLRYSVSK